MPRRTQQSPQRLPDHVIEGFEKRVSAQGGLVRPDLAGSFQELVELRAMVKDLIGHLNALEKVSA